MLIILLADRPDERADDAGYEGRNWRTRKHESQHEPPRSAADSDGIREGE